MEIDSEEVTHSARLFLRYVSLGLLDLQLFSNSETRPKIEGLTKELCRTFFSESLQGAERDYQLAIVEGLRYNISVLNHLDAPIELARAVFTKHSKFVKSIKYRGLCLRAEWVEHVTKFNHRFDDLLYLQRKYADELRSELRTELNALASIDLLTYPLEMQRAWGAKSPGLLAFISHTSDDKPLARQISSELENAGILTWLDEKDIVGGQSIPAEITSALEQCTHFLLIVSEKSSGKPWIKTELNSVLMRRNTHPKRLPDIIPILLDGLKPPGLISEIKGIQFSKINVGMLELYKIFNVNPNQILSVTDIFKVKRKAMTLLDSVAWCFQADHFLPINEETFWNLVECEDFLYRNPLSDTHTGRYRFAFSGMGFSNQGQDLVYDEEFYSYYRSGLIASHLVKAYISILKKIRDYIGGRTNGAGRIA
jgi:TIR domain